MTARIRPPLVLALAVLAAVVGACDVLPAPSPPPTLQTDPGTAGPRGPEAIAMAIGAYLNVQFPALDPKLVAVGAYVVFMTLNFVGVSIAA